MCLFQRVLPGAYIKYEIRSSREKLIQKNLMCLFQRVLPGAYIKYEIRSSREKLIGWKKESVFELSLAVKAQNMFFY